MIKKILVIRFSSIGDIVLTSPVVRCLKEQIPGAEIHFVTKAAFREVLEHNPYLHTLWSFKEDISELYEPLKAEKFDVLIDLHHNLRSLRLKQRLGVRSYRFNKLNIKKFLAVRLKMRNQLPDVHIVDRYLETVRPLGIKNDGKGLDYFIGPEAEMDVMSRFFNGVDTRYLALVIGGSYFTKQIPLVKLQEIVSASPWPVILLGGASDKSTGLQLTASIPQKQVFNACGEFSLNQSACILRSAEWVITSDTGLMHIAAAFHKKIVSVWGNTIPEFGMGVYKPVPESKVLQVEGLSCRPCSKLGYKKCPEGHFKCMMDQNVQFIADLK